MTIINKSITFQGALTTVTSITIYPQAGGSYIVVANGVASDGAGNTEPISVSATFPSGTTVLDNVSATALQKLRQANGLEV
jgi:hypothetical protein